MKSHEHLQFNGYLATPSLWCNHTLYNLKQLDVPLIKSINNEKFDYLSNRLGHRVEDFVFRELESIPDYDLLAKNIQIFDDKITLGELDALIKLKEKYIHLEIVYKFYLYDNRSGTNEIDYWIGPNRKDSLIEKIEKLHTKQLPLLYNPLTKKVLEILGVDVSKVEQQVYFKAQLFIPYQTNIICKKINKACIMGYYIAFDAIDYLDAEQFYIPEKNDWLTIPHESVEWINTATFKTFVKKYLDKQQSPLCWIKTSEGTYQKIFITWWE